jgi:putative addiction module CopG family antidote
MTVTLTPELEQIVKEQLATGQFTDAEQVIAVSLRFLRQQYEELKGLIAESAAQADRGELAPLDVRGTLAAIRARKQKRAAEG